MDYTEFAYNDALDGSEVVANVTANAPENLQNIVRRCLMTDPTLRPTIEELRLIIQGQIMLGAGDLKTRGPADEDFEMLDFERDVYTTFAGPTAPVAVVSGVSFVDESSSDASSSDESG